eukprot:CAMPEP_0181129570 /NCGR_PEP_ID=MMETSP1071-20121207/29391_1 /TAXON_ID=35127 /ORGANISM="Thalassiosira sp., Strain NH16" /LENGTH=496 /DNA_ID=CAMNT_0023215563 /DNA_START=18 /DNA_END=1508 /DNA_ORIENTATION=-
MELRKVEQELENLSSVWKSLRRKRPRFKDDDDAGLLLPSTVAARGGTSSGDESLSAKMPSWKELQSKVKDDELFPAEEEEEIENDGTVTAGSPVINNNDSGTDATNDNGGNKVDADTAAAGYSEFGMCLAPSGNAEESSEGAKDTTSSASDGGGSIFARYAAKNTVAAKSKVKEEKKTEHPKQAMGDVDLEEDEPLSIEDATFKSVIADLESLQERLVTIGPKIEKFLTKLKERDPVTKKPRYGAKTMPRIKHVIRTYKAIEQGVAIVFHGTYTDPSLVSSLRSKMQQFNEELNAQIESRKSQQQLEENRVANEKLLAEERANQQRLLEEQRRRNEERELARLAEEARQRRVEEEKCLLEAERRADRELLELVPTVGVEGVREQIARMREALKDDRAALDTSLGSLYTLFEQIVRKPEEINFRRVRRDHPKFMEDIGRHVGGREVLIAAGFKLEKLDGVPSFFSKEPHIESDMDGWSNWFDMLKKTLEVIEDEMLK